MKAWPKVALGELLRRTDESAVVDPTAEYHEVTIKPESVTPPPRCSSQVVDVAKHLLRVDADSASPCG